MHGFEDDSDCHTGGQSKGLSYISFFTFLEYKTWYIFNTPCNHAHQNDCAEVSGIDSGCTVLEDFSASEKRGIIP